MLLSFRKLSKLMCENAPQFLKFRVALVTGASASSSGLLRPSIPTPPARPQGGRPVWRGDAAGTSAIALCAWRCASGSGRTRGRRADAQGSRARWSRVSVRTSGEDAGRPARCSPGPLQCPRPHFPATRNGLLGVPGRGPIGTRPWPREVAPGHALPGGPLGPWRRLPHCCW